MQIEDDLQETQIVFFFSGKNKNIFINVICWNLNFPYKELNVKNMLNFKDLTTAI